MNDNQQMLQRYETQLKSLKSFIKELNDRVDQHGTAQEMFAADIIEAEHNVTYYEGEISRLKELIEEESGRATYFVYEDSSRQWRWQLRAANNRIIADSGEGYHNKQDCLHGIALVKDSKDAPVKEGE